MYSTAPVQPRPNHILDAVPTPRPTPYLMDGVGVDEPPVRQSNPMDWSWWKKTHTPLCVSSLNHPPPEEVVPGTHRHMAINSTPARVTSVTVIGSISPEAIRPVVDVHVAASTGAGAEAAGPPGTGGVTQYP
jgi:hypothetical protein